MDAGIRNLPKEIINLVNEECVLQGFPVTPQRFDLFISLLKLHDDRIGIQDLEDF